MAKRANEEKVVKPLVRLTKLPNGAFRYGDGSAYPDARLFEDADVIPVVFVEKQPDGSYEYVEAGETVVTWSEIQGKPSTFPPSAHTHEIADVNGLQSILDGKASANHNHDGVYQPVGDYAEASHTHAISDIPGLQSALDSKLTATKAAAVADSSGATDTVLEEKFNELLASLRAAGILAE
ncbi:phage tail fiber repeat family protein [Thermoactinomyces vulgaris]|jgi:hypothetical protein|uniref:hypothetical protein n=1 Tax=Thermoactinomyces vulgaris TaxID=2026 RepID=UPI0036259E20